MHAPNRPGRMKPDSHSSDHMFAVLLMTYQGREGRNESYQRAQEVGERAFKDAAAGVRVCEGPESCPFVVNPVETSSSPGRIVNRVGAEERC